MHSITNRYNVHWNSLLIHLFSRIMNTYFKSNISIESKPFLKYC